MSEIELSLDSYPLVNRYFGDYLRNLVRARQIGPGYDGYFVDHAFYSEALEARLKGLEELGLTQAIVDEVGNTDDAQELDRRLMDAWAEIRAMDQLQREVFVNIQKVRAIADFTAERSGVQYAVQATHPNKVLKKLVAENCQPGKINVSPWGPVDEVRDRFAKPVFHLFRNSVLTKNRKFSEWPIEGSIRCIVIVTNQPLLQDGLVRHVACQQLRACIHFPRERHFEELLWLLDNGNGARFLVGETPDQTRCLANWKDGSEGPGTGYLWSDMSQVVRREVDLDAWLPAWREETV